MFGRAIRTRRPSRDQRSAAARAARSPGSSASAATTTARTSGGSVRPWARLPAETALHAGSPSIRPALALLSMPSAMSSSRRNRVEPNGAAPNPTKRCALRLHSRLAAAIASQEGAMDGHRLVGHVHHQCHHRRQAARVRVRTVGVETQRRRGGEAGHRTAGEVGVRDRAHGRSAAGPQAQGEGDAVGAVAWRLGPVSGGGVQWGASRSSRTMPARSWQEAQ